MNGTKDRLLTGCLAAGLLLFLGGTRAGAQVSAQVDTPIAAQQQTEDWRVEFEAVCATTDASMTFTVAELTDFIARCDKLAERIGAEEETIRRVYLRRLKMCRDLLAFVLESKKVGQPEAGKPGP
jgi:hypothetical protein